MTEKELWSLMDKIDSELRKSMYADGELRKRMEQFQNENGDIGITEAVNLSIAESRIYTLNLIRSILVETNLIDSKDNQ